MALVKLFDEMNANRDDKIQDYGYPTDAAALSNAAAARATRPSCAAARHGARPAAPHGAGRSHRIQVRQPRDRPPQPRDAGRRHARGHLPAPAKPASAAFIATAETPARQHGRVPGTGVRDARLRRLLFGSTPIREIAELNIGSRPARATRWKRNIEDPAPAPGASVAGVSAVSRSTAGTASAAPSRASSTVRTARHRPPSARTVALLQRMYAQWPFFRTLSNMDMVRLPRATCSWPRYAELVADRKLRQKVFGMIDAEWHRTSEAHAHHRRQAAAGGQRRHAAPGAPSFSLHRFHCTTCRRN